jgi:hypothetical protein
LHTCSLRPVIALDDARACGSEESQGGGRIGRSAAGVAGGAELAEGRAGGEGGVTGLDSDEDMQVLSLLS